MQYIFIFLRYLTRRLIWHFK